MSTDNPTAPRCKLCGHEMYMTRFLADVSEKRIDRDYYYECLWCGDDGAVKIHAAAERHVEGAVA
jgi:hypothetical protein